MREIDVIDITKSAISQLINRNFYDAETPELTPTDVTALAELGHALEDHQNAPDIFLNSLIDQLATMRIDSRKYTAVLPKLFVDTYEWGGFREHVIIGLSDIMQDEMYPINGFINYSDQGGEDEAVRIAGIEHGTYKPPTAAKFYDEAKAYMIAVSTVREQLFTAVKSLAELNKLISALKVSVDNTIQLRAEVGALYTVATGVTRAIALNNEIPLVSLFNADRAATATKEVEIYVLQTEEPDDWSTAYGDYYVRNTDGTFTVNTETTWAADTFYTLNKETRSEVIEIPTGWGAMQYPEFVAFALETIANTKDNFKRFTSVYNNHDHVTFSSEPNLILLSMFANRAKFGVRANTFNEQLLGIGDYDKITGWQATQSTGGSPFEFDTLSTIALTSTAASKVGFTPSGTDPVVLTNIIGCLYDRYAMGVSLDKEKVTTSYTASQDKWNTFHHELINYIIDDNFPIVAFTLN